MPTIFTNPSTVSTLCCSDKNKEGTCLVDSRVAGRKEFTSMGSLGFKKFHNEVFFSVLLLSGSEVHKISLADAEGNGCAKSNNPTKKEKISFLNSVEL
jgi:hypothetical protein